MNTLSLSTSPDFIPPEWGIHLCYLCEHFRQLTIDMRLSGSQASFGTRRPVNLKDVIDLVTENSAEVGLRRFMKASTDWGHSSILMVLQVPNLGQTTTRSERIQWVSVNL